MPSLHTHSRCPEIDEGGFTLAEVIVSLAILVTVAVAVTSLILTSMRATSENQLKVTAANLAQQDVQKMRALSDSQLTDQIVSTTAAVTVGRTVFSLRRSVVQCNASTTGGTVSYSCGSSGTCAAGSYKSVSTVVAWPRGFRTVQLATRIAC